ncbi:hypothetical protein L6164_010742 [Bauhinia variegata]|uniref:Uncharacterized protein n=1 Tax=Bauhinia variegata TaxID=167791 RepID=A0ACB9P6A0_BAUVA|nr:hypothetical protein L6164_010742 [Bauhinia variegata]
MFNISYIRGLFPEKYFNDKSVPALGVYDALQKKYLKTLLFCVCEAADGPMIEEYAFSFSYADSDKQEVSMNINRIGNKKQRGTFKCNSTTEITPQQMSSSGCKMIRTLVQLMRTLDARSDYEPPFFRFCTEEESHHPWTESPLKMEVGNVNSKHFVSALTVKSFLDPCEIQNEGLRDDDMRFGSDSVQRDGYTDSDCQFDHFQGDQYRVAPIEKQQAQEDKGLTDEDNTQDPVEDEQQLALVKEWVNSCHLDNIELTDVLSNFPDISLIKLHHQKSEYEFTPVKEEIDDPIAQFSDKDLQVEDSVYVKALYHALPMKYVTIAKLEGEVSQTAVRKIIDKITREGFLEPTGKRRLGKRVIHSELSERKLIEVQKALSTEHMDVNPHELNKKSKQIVIYGNVSNYRDASTCRVLRSIGSDLTRMRVRSDTNQTDSIRSGQTTAKAKESGNTPTSRVEASFINKTSIHNRVRVPHLAMSSQDKLSRKTSMVKEPILQNLKRQRP